MKQLGQLKQKAEMAGRKTQTIIRNMYASNQWYRW